MDLEGVKHSVEITAGSLFEAAIIGMNAMKVPDWFNRSTTHDRDPSEAAGNNPHGVERGPHGMAGTEGENAERDGVEGEVERVVRG
jgi:hypothetical protein